MSSDSSSSDDETSRLKEAVDTSLLRDDLYKNDIAEKKPGEKPAKSLRNQNHEGITMNPFSLKVTPEFQKHVSRHLSKLLDKTTDDTKVFLKIKKQKKKYSIGGVKLLLTSKGFLDSETEIYGNLIKHKRNTCEEKIDYEARAKEVAVSPEWVLRKAEVKYWAPSWRNNVEILKLENCKNKRKRKKRKAVANDISI